MTCAMGHCGNGRGMSASPKPRTNYGGILRELKPADLVARCGRRGLEGEIRSPVLQQAESQHAMGSIGLTSAGASPVFSTRVAPIGASALPLNRASRQCDSDISRPITPAPSPTRDGIRI